MSVARAGSIRPWGGIEMYLPEPNVYDGCITARLAQGNNCPAE